MLTVKIEINGRIIDVIDICNVSPTIKPKVQCDYNIRHWNREEGTVDTYSTRHFREDGRLELIGLVLDVIR